MPRLFLQPIRVGTGEDEEGALILIEDRLVGVLVHLSRQHGPLAGCWFLEASFGPTLDVITRPIFPDLDAARTWIIDRIANEGGHGPGWDQWRERPGDPAH